MKSNNIHIEETNILEYIESFKTENKRRISMLIFQSVFIWIVVIISGIYFAKEISVHGFNTHMIGEVCDISAFIVVILFVYKKIYAYSKRDYTAPTLQLLKNIRKDYIWVPQKTLIMIFILGLLNVKYFLSPEIHYIRILIINLIVLTVVFLFQYFYNYPRSQKLSKLIKELEGN